MISVHFNDEAVMRMLTGVAAQFDDMTELMTQIGEALLASSKDRAAQGISPDGTAFAPLSQTTLDHYARLGKSSSGPLRQSGDMISQLNYAAGRDHVEVGSNAVQAAMMQFGGSRSEFPNLWGDIPARPFIGLSDEDGTAILETIEDWLENSAPNGN